MKCIKFIFMIPLTMFLMNGMVFGQDTTLTVTTDGNIGIGTTSPETRLHVLGRGRVEGLLQLYGSISEARNAKVNFRFPDFSGFLFDWDIEVNRESFDFVIRGDDAFNVNTERLVVENETGNVGIGTLIPEQKLHVAGGYILANGLGNEQAYLGGDGAGGDVQVGSFNSEVTNFAIWNAATSTRMNLFANDMLAFGKIGVGTTTPSAPLTVQTISGADIQFVSTGTNADISSTSELRVGTSNNSSVSLLTDDRFRLTVTGDGKVGIGTTSPNHPLEMESGAHVTEGGVWTDASSKQFKENISNLTEVEAITALENLNPVKFNYKKQKEEEYLGFIAEDVPDLVATGDRKSLSPMDIVAVLTKVVQQQQKKIAELEARLDASQ